MDTATEPLESRIRASFARQSMLATLKATLDEVAEGRCVISAPLLPETRQQHGAGHAGATFTLVDTAAGYAALTLIPPGTEVMTAEMKINLLSPAIGDRLIATGEVVRAGRRLIVVRGEVVAEEAGRTRTIAIVQGTMIPVDPPAGA
ncbi:PaaI family thioesterase [Haematobacter genomosp. 1]|uniref:Phenylacetic acid degradation protein n=1 Tax=Haematobacter genomosp. 1 TaxID=366618 RepID=A0A212A7M5_9RHOB|nr:PaaI family thioesterase [Haematobacter genomosp. 1]OWJ75577.1 phenylacetic acid degradation protein [Haematobacter genomosp. 1]